RDRVLLGLALRPSRRRARRTTPAGARGGAHPALALGWHLRRARSLGRGRAARDVTRVPLLADSRIVVGEPGATDVVLRPHAARDHIEDVPAAVRDALAFPLDGPPLEQLVTRGGTATIVIEQPALPSPGVPHGPRHEAIATVADDLDRRGVGQVTILVAGALLRRTAPREIGLLVPPE